MKKVILYYFVAILAIFSLSSCLYTDEPLGGEFTVGDILGETTVHLGKADSINYMHQVSEKGLESALETMDKIKLLGQLLPAQYSLRGGKEGNPPGPHAYQFQYSLQIDNYAGYFCAPQDFNGRLKSTYYDSQDFNGGAYGTFTEVQKNIVPVLNHPQIDSIPEIKAVSLLIFNLMAQEVADVYGPFPYANIKANKQEHPYVYNSLDTIYATIVNNVDTVVACFKHFRDKPEWYKTKINALLQQYDKSSPESSNKLDSWTQLANSLKLRLAMNMVKVNPDLAKQWAEEAVQEGVIETPEQQLAISPQKLGFSHPLIEISTTWNDTRLNASLESILKAYDHPVLKFLFTKNTYPIINLKDPSKIYATGTGYVGLRSGIRMLSKQAYSENFRVAYSQLTDAILEMPLFLIKLSEVQFLRAEGALRGWNMGGSAESFYNLGIQQAYAGTLLKMMNDDTNWEAVEFDTEVYRPGLNTYMSLENAKNITYVDPADDAYNMESKLKVGVKWNNGDDNETKLEKIITQKYIAGFPNSYVAWTDIRRTGYPRIFPVVYDDGDGSIEKGDVIRRIPFSGTTLEAVRKDIEATGLKALGGPDKQGTHLWWDKTGSNF